MDVRAAMDVMALFDRPQMTVHPECANDSGSTEGHDQWEKNSSGISQAIRNKITEVISINLRSPTPLRSFNKRASGQDGSRICRRQAGGSAQARDFLRS
jgi:hypothetical protein